jgi:hypothetical protein
MLQPTGNDYYDERMKLLGVTPETNTFLVWQTEFEPGPDLGKKVLKPHPVFAPHPKGIEIFYCTLDRQLIRYRKQPHLPADQVYSIVRHQYPLIGKDDKPKKYLLPAKQPTNPFFPPALIEKYHEALEFKKKFPGKELPEGWKITNLYFTEGNFKGWKGQDAGIDIVAFASITCMKDASGGMYPDVLKLVVTCEVERLIWLTDGDCRDLSTSAIAEGKDLYSRPSNFFNTISTFYELFSGLPDVKKFFAHINTEDIKESSLKSGERGAGSGIEGAGRSTGSGVNWDDDNFGGSKIFVPGSIAHARATRNNEVGEVTTENAAPLTAHPPTLTDDIAPKGLDDIFVLFPDKRVEIVTEFNDFSRINGKTGEHKGNWITRIHIGMSIARISAYFFLNSVDRFYEHHVQNRPDLAIKETFVFNGTTYSYDKEKGSCIVQVPREAADYFRVVDTYYKKIEIPTVNFLRDETTVKTITAIAKGALIDDFGKGFLKNVVSYNQFCIVPSHTNYQPVIHGCYNMYAPFTHVPDDDGDCDFIINLFKHIFGTQEVSPGIQRWELGMDYAKILLERPDQMLPILSLVSKDRQTAKTSFAELLEQIFVENTISVGNEDMTNDFNAHWVSKLLIICDETHINDIKVIQKIKRLSTANGIVMNDKGKRQTRLPFFGKFIMISNHVRDFIRIEKDEIRFWVIEVPRLQKIDPDYKEKMKTQIPAFLYYLGKRAMVTERRERHWFETKLLRTDALLAVMENSINRVDKAITQKITWLFDMLPEETELRLPSYKIAELIGAKNVESENYMQSRLRETFDIKSLNARFTYPDKMIETWVPAQGIERGYFLRAFNWTKTNTSYYLFERKNFMNTDEKAKDDEPEPPGVWMQGGKPIEAPPPAPTEPIEELPF